MSIRMDLIPNLYRIATNQKIENTAEYLLWENHFDYLHGGVENLKKATIEELFFKYNINSDYRSIKLLIFCLETHFSFSMEIRSEVIFDNITGSERNFLDENFLFDDKLKNFFGLRAWLYSWALADGQYFSFLKDLFKELKKDISWKNTYHGDFAQIEYNELFTKEIRHSIGAYFTPDWLAEKTINEIGISDFKNKRFIEPTSGSGVFLISLFKVIKEKQYSFKTIRDLFVKDVECYELNPASVIACRMNWLRIFSEISAELMLEDVSEIRCPVFFRDCLITGETKNVSGKNKDRIEPVVSRLGQNYLFDRISHYKEHNQSCYEFCQSYLLAEPSDVPFDYVVGNPPWINWENLNSEFRKSFSSQWPSLGLFPAESQKSKNFSKEDLSTFVLYYCAKNYLCNGGTLAFLMPQSVFQSASNSKGFRGFYLLCDNTHLGVIKVDDYSSMPVFKGASARTSVIFLEKGTPTLYPIPYKKITRDKKNGSLIEQNFLAKPLDSKDISSSWMIYPEKDADALKQLEGRSQYRARAGMFTGGANAVYYVEILEDRGANYLVKNVTERAKVFVAEQTFEIEKDVVFPFARGRDVEFWGYTHSPIRGVIFPHTKLTKMAPICESEFSINYPRAYSYFENNKELLLTRGGLTTLDTNSMNNGYYTLLRIGEYTFAEYKVVWKYICKEFTCAVLGPEKLLNDLTKPVIPQEKLMIISTSSAEEAYYLCGYLSSRQVKTAVESRMVSTQISAHVINQINVPKYDPKNPLHNEISIICKTYYSNKKEKGKALGLISQIVERMLLS